MRALIELNFDNNSFSTIVWKILGNDRSKILTLNNNIVEFYNNSSIIDKFTAELATPPAVVISVLLANAVFTLQKIIDAQTANSIALLPLIPITLLYIQI